MYIRFYIINSIYIDYTASNHAFRLNTVLLKEKIMKTKAIWHKITHTIK